MDLTKKGINRIHIGRIPLGGFPIKLVIATPTKMALGIHERVKAENEFDKQIAPKVIISFRVYNKITGKLLHQYDGPMYDWNKDFFKNSSCGYWEFSPYPDIKKLGYCFEYPFLFGKNATYLEYMNPFISNDALDEDRIVEFEVIEPMPKSTWHEYHKAKFIFQWTYGK